LGASCTSHLGSTAITFRMYSLERKGGRKGKREGRREEGMWVWRATEADTETRGRMGRSGKGRRKEAAKEGKRERQWRERKSVKEGERERQSRERKSVKGGRAKASTEGKRERQWRERESVNGLLGGHNELVIQDPLRALVEERRGRVDIDQIVVDDGFEAFLRVFFRHVGEVPRADGLLDFLIISAFERGRREGEREGGRVRGGRAG